MAHLPDLGFSTIPAGHFLSSVPGLSTADLLERQVPDWPSRRKPSGQMQRWLPKGVRRQISGCGQEVGSSGLHRSPPQTWLCGFLANASGHLQVGFRLTSSHTSFLVRSQPVWACTLQPEGGGGGRGGEGQASFWTCKGRGRNAGGMKEGLLAHD
jgi:hypothetical protein